MDAESLYGKSKKKSSLLLLNAMKSKGRDFSLAQLGQVQKIERGTIHLKKRYGKHRRKTIM